MKRDDVITTLRRNEAILNALGVRHVEVFGSIARGQDGSDVDLQAVFDKTLSLTDLVQITRMIEEMLGSPVDLVEKGTLKPRVRARVEAEAVLAF